MVKRKFSNTLSKKYAVKHFYVQVKKMGKLIVNSE